MIIEDLKVKITVTAVYIGPNRNWRWWKFWAPRLVEKPLDDSALATIMINQKIEEV